MPKKSSLFVVVSILSAIGLVMVYSASYIFAREKYGGDGLFFFKKHIAYMMIGFMGMFIASKLSPDFWERWIRLIIIGCMVLLALVLIPGMGWKSGGAVRWINLFGFKFQPSEIIKGSTVIYLAYVFSITEDIKYAKFAMLVPVFGLLLLQPDFGTPALLSSVFLVMFFLKGKNLKHLFLAIAGVGTLATIFIVNSPYRMKRIMVFLNPWADPSNSGFQIIQSFVAFTAGKFSGAGLGNGKEKLFYLPAVHNDFIFSVVGEELGFIGVMAVILVFAFLIYTGFKIASSAKGFSAYLAAGFTVLIANQTMINMGVVLGMFPTKGLTLPFISYGGTATIANLTWMGIVMSVANSVDGKKGIEINSFEEAKQVAKDSFTNATSPVLEKIKSKFARKKV